MTHLLGQLAGSLCCRYNHKRVR